jgi:5-formyltetrahydrofolate cyclo-ligase
MIIDRSAPIPIYFQIARNLRALLEQGDLMPGDQLPPEDELAARLRVSRMTLRQALVSLADEGLLTRQRGRGTFVTERAGELATHQSFLPSVEGRLRQQGFRLDQRLLGISVIPVPSSIVAESLQLAAADSVLQVVLLHLADDEPVALSHIYVPDRLCPDLAAENLTGSSFPEILRQKYGYSLVAGSEWCEAVAAPEEIGVELSAGSGDPLMLISAVMNLAGGPPLLFSQTFWRSGRVHLSLPNHNTALGNGDSNSLPGAIARATESNQTKQLVRGRIWEALQEVARPDSRFHWDFSEFIPDYEGSARCAETIRALPWYQDSRLLFITPDNNLAPLRAAALRDNKRLVVPTHGLVRGFMFLERAGVPSGQEEFAATLDGLERFARPLPLDELATLGHFDLLVTGASAIAPNGVRWGKGHGYFDLEWALLRELRAVDEQTPVVAAGHDLQVLDYDLEPSPYDAVVDLIVTPTRCLPIERIHPKPPGIIWEAIPPHVLDSIPILNELASRNGHGT